VGGAASYMLGCGGDDGGEATPSPTASSAGMTPAATVAGRDFTPVLLTTEFAANQPARFLVGLLDADGGFVANADVGLRFFTLAADGMTGTLRDERAAEYVELEAPASSTAGRELGETIGFYRAAPELAVPGRWAVEVAATPPGGSEAKIQAAFEVYEQYRIPAPDAVPPASQNDTFATNTNIASLCSRDPACPLHDKVIADYLGKGRPLVVQFSTPAFCETRFCGPVLDVLLEDVPAYEDRIDFVHIEVWQDFQLRQYRAATREWNLPTEPITFFMRPDGSIQGFLEAVFTREEQRAALDALLA
jgi:hypothetical protein